ncbi:transcriptional regulator domain-containing protein [Manganibacter manganicus]|uniref:transcriptional regulator domain-containing protein n=1 Tax=Manganibacter manganicus TaxID=1873176 RepID=UPI0009B95D6D|nr:DUF6499 domain-containing protein [Pseudaminobacter manganicus]
MLLDPSQWWSSAEYAYAEDLTASDMAWEWLRRNEAYDRDFEALTAADDSEQSLMEEIRRHWGLFCPARSPRGSP